MPCNLLKRKIKFAQTVLLRSYNAGDRLCHDRWYDSDLLVPKLSTMYPANVSKVGFNPAGVLLNPWGLPFPWIPMQIVPQLPSWPGVVIRELH